MKALLTRKLGMTSTINPDGVAEAITLLSVGEHTVIDHKTDEQHGYTAVRIGVETTKNLPKSLLGQLKQVKIMPKIIREFRLAQIPEELSVGSKLKADVFSVGDIVHVTGISKGKGWAGTIKRHNFHRGRKTHGGRSYRRPGSIGSMYPQHILKGKKMAGQMGHVQVTVRNLKISLVDTDHNVIGVSGAVPGPRRSLVVLRGVKS
ncbi:MAG TPA: 50S ribosomal protein L3 [Candidatus Dormibacteraeota bacterium]|nr:50S ribosomal protein L3 [Candidatus Dormibacteraeota bacterium]